MESRGCETEADTDTAGGTNTETDKDAGTVAATDRDTRTEADADKPSVISGLIALSKAKP